MADNSIQTGADTIATDDVTTLNGGASSGIKVQRVKNGFGSDGTYVDVDAANPLPVTAASLPLPTGAAQDGTDITTPTAMPVGGVGIRGWLSAIWTKLNASLAVTGTFWQATQPVSIATNTPDVTDRSGRLLGTIANTSFAVTNAGTFAVQAAATLQAGTAIAGKFGIDQTTPGTTNLVSIGTNGTVAVNAALPTGANTIGAVNIAAAQTLATVTTVGAVTAITNALPAGTNKIGTVDIATAAATAKGTQGTNAVPTQDLKDAGRNQVTYYSLIPVLSSATDTLQSLTGTKAGVTVAATTTPAVVTAGKTLRVTRVAATYIATATSGYAILRLRFNTAGVVAITSPVAATIAIGSGTPATANATGAEEATLDEGWEFAAGTGIGISVQGFAAVTATAVGYVMVSVTGYEY